MMTRSSRIVDDPTVAPRIRDHVRRAKDARIGGNLRPQLARLRVAIREEPAPALSTRRLQLAFGIAIPTLACVFFGLASVVSSGGPAEPADQQPHAEPPEPPPPTVPSRVETTPPDSVAREQALDTRSIHDLPSVRERPVQRKAGGAATLDDEIAQLAEVRTLSVGDPARALSAAEAGHRRFPSGVLYQEREAIAIDSLKRLHRFEEARRRAQRFIQSFPDSPFAKRVGAGGDDL